jgi:hypothetical protein
VLVHPAAAMVIKSASIAITEILYVHIGLLLSSPSRCTLLPKTQSPHSLHIVYTIQRGKAEGEELLFFAVLIGRPLLFLRWRMSTS